MINSQKYIHFFIIKKISIPISPSLTHCPKADIVHTEADPTKSTVHPKARKTGGPQRTRYTGVMMQGLPVEWEEWEELTLQEGNSTRQTDKALYIFYQLKHLRCPTAPREQTKLIHKGRPLPVPPIRSH